MCVRYVFVCSMQYVCTTVHTCMCVCERTTERTSRDKIAINKLYFGGENCLIFGNEILIFVSFHYTVDVNSLALSPSVSFTFSYYLFHFATLCTVYLLRFILRCYSVFTRFNIITKWREFLFARMGRARVLFRGKLILFRCSPPSAVHLPIKSLHSLFFSPLFSGLSIHKQPLCDRIIHNLAVLLPLCVCDRTSYVRSCQP